MQLHKVAISLDDGAIALAHTMLKIGIWVRTLYQFFTVSGKIFPQKKMSSNVFDFWHCFCKYYFIPIGDDTPVV